MSEQSEKKGIPSIPSRSLDYRQEPYRHGSLQFVPVYNNQYGNTIQMSSGQQPVVFNLPTDVFNLGRSYLIYTVSLPAVASNYIWYPQDTIGEIARIQFYGSSGQFICDLDNVQNYFKIVGKHETSFSDYITSDPVNRLTPSNCPNNIVPALRVQSGNAGAVPSSLSYIEPAYFAVGGLNSIVSYQVQLPLNAFKNTILSTDKNFYFNQIMYLKIFFGPISKVAFQSTSNGSPNSGTITAYNGAATVSNLQLMLASETNTDERERSISQIQNGGGMSMVIPFAWNYMNSVASGGTQNINLQLDIGSGRTLMRMYHSVFNGAVNQANVILDCSNQQRGTSGADATLSEKVNQYYTNINGKRVQTITIDTTYNGFATDYLNIKNSLKGSVLENMNVFKYNWHHLDDFSDFKNEYIQDGETSLIAGYPLGPTPITWSFIGSSMVDAAYIHYSWGIFTKRLTIGLSGATVD